MYEFTNNKKKYRLRLLYHSLFVIRYSLLILFFVLLSAVFCLPSFAQDIHFSQFLNAPLLLNPATAGVGDGDWRASLTHKSQWIAVTKYNTSSASFDMPLLKNSGKAGYLGAGFNVFADRAGTARLGTTQATFSVSGILPIGDFQKVSVGLQSGIAQRSASLNKLSWGNQFTGEGFDQSIGSNEPNSASFIYPDVAAGVNYEFSQDAHAMLGKDVTKASVGAAVFHPHSPKQKFLGTGQKMYLKMVFHASAYKDFNDIKLALIPSFAYFLQGPHSEMNMGMRFRYRIQEGTKWSGVFNETAFSVACQYRLKDAIIPAVFFEISNYMFALTYDYPISKPQKTGMMSGFEISIIYSMLNSGLRKSGKE